MLRVAPLYHCGMLGHLSFPQFTYSALDEALCGLLAIALLASPSVALASSRTPAEATQHAIDDLANVCAQRRPECPATLTPTPTATPSPTSTHTPQPTDRPTSTPMPTETPTPEPCWLIDQDLGDPDDNYIVFDEDGAPVPCPSDQPLPTDEPAPTPESRAVNAEDPAIARPTPVVVSAASQPVAAAAPLPTYTPYPTYTPLPTYTAAPTSTLTSIATATLTRTPAATVTATPTVVSVAGVRVTSAPVGSISHSAESAPGQWSWPAFLGYLAAAIGIVVLLVAFVTRRKVAVWKGAPD